LARSWKQGRTNTSKNTFWLRGTLASALLFKEDTAKPSAFSFSPWHQNSAMAQAWVLNQQIRQLKNAITSPEMLCAKIHQLQKKLHKALANSVTKLPLLQDTSPAR
jgi:hypothetical protein